MGLPVVALLGESMISRQTASLLTAAGLPQWIAQSDAQWHELNVALASSPDDLRRWRVDARRLLARAPLCDGPLFARRFGEVILATIARAA